MLSVVHSLCFGVVYDVCVCMFGVMCVWYMCRVFGVMRDVLCMMCGVWCSVRLCIVFVICGALCV